MVHVCKVLKSQNKPEMKYWVAKNQETKCEWCFSRLKCNTSWTRGVSRGWNM